MTSLWVLVVAITVIGTFVLALALRHAHDEVEPTVRAFAAFRDALRPAVAGLRADSAETLDRLDRHARVEAPNSQG